MRQPLVLAHIPSQVGPLASRRRTACKCLQTHKA